MDCSNRYTDKLHTSRIRSVRLLACCKLEVSAMLVIRKLRHGDLTPEIRGEEGVSFSDGCKGSLQEVTHRRCRALRLRLAILNTSELQQAF